MDEVVRRRTEHGAFVRGAALFDNGIFGVSPAEAVSTDPQQRLVLEHAYVALVEGGVRRAARAAGP